MVTSRWERRSYICPTRGQTCKHSYHYNNDLDDEEEDVDYDNDDDDNDDDDQGQTCNHYYLYKDENDYDYDKVGCCDDEDVDDFDYLEPGVNIVIILRMARMLLKHNKVPRPDLNRESLSK